MGRDDEQEKRTEASDECEKHCKGIEVPSEAEMVALNAMKTIKERVRYLKKRLLELSSSKGGGNNEEILTVEGEMAELKVQWNQWEEKRKEAARERMVLLGHEEGL